MTNQTKMQVTIASKPLTKKEQDEAIAHMQKHFPNANVSFDNNTAFGMIEDNTLFYYQKGRLGKKLYVKRKLWQGWNATLIGDDGKQTKIHANFKDTQIVEVLDD